MRYHSWYPILLVFMLVAGCGVSDYWERTKQIRTYSDLQVAAAKISSTQGESASLMEVRIHRILSEISDGRDAWGNKFRAEVSASGSYVLLSTGSDGFLDLPSIEDYFSAEPASVQGEFSRDIVFRDGKVIWNAGK